MKPLENKKFAYIRAKLISKARGEVLEIGCGTGANFDLYRGGLSVTAIEPNPVMRIAANKRAAEAHANIRVLEGNAEQLSFADNSFDTVVGTLVLCTIPNPIQAIREMKRVCKPDGTILLFEHVRHEHILLGKLQDMITPIWKRVCDGCHLNRDTVTLLRHEGIHMMEVNQYIGNIFVTIGAKPGIYSAKN